MKKRPKQQHGDLPAVENGFLRASHWWLPGKRKAKIYAATPRLYFQTLFQHNVSNEVFRVISTLVLNERIGI